MLLGNLMLAVSLILNAVTSNGRVNEKSSDIELLLQERSKHRNHRVKSDKNKTTHKRRKETNKNASPHPPRHMGGAVVFRDDFNTLDLTKWKHEVSMYGGYNNEFQVYTNDPQNSFTRNGFLYIKPTLTVSDPRFDEDFLHHGTMDMKALFGRCTNNFNHGCHRTAKNGVILPPVMSAKIKSLPTIRYGVVEVRARICKGDWLWPAIWMKPRDHAYGTWPRSGEIDLMESRGNPGYFGVDNVASALHWGPDAARDSARKTAGKRFRKRHTWDNGFHTWRLEWTPDYIVMYVDNKQIMYADPGKSFWAMGGFTGKNLWAKGTKMAPFDQDFYLILNVAVGGTSGMFSNKNIHKPWKTSSPSSAMEDFWKARKSWENSWDGDKVAMVVDYIEMRNL